VLIACWSAKGGSGTTAVSAALALQLARKSAAGAVIADLAGDVPAVLGLPDPAGPGLADWFRAGSTVPVDALERLEVEAAPRLRLLPRGDGELGEAGRAGVLAGLLAGDARPVVVDCGRLESEPGRVIAAEATVSLLVTRACYLSLRRAAAAPIRPSGVVLLTEHGRCLGRRDVEEVLGVPVRAEIKVEASVARAIDAGLLASRLPRPLNVLAAAA
jgi:hypothetical protein